MLQKSNTSRHDQIKPLRNTFTDIYQYGKVYKDYGTPNYNESHYPNNREILAQR